MNPSKPDSNQLLDGFRVVEISAFVAAPLAGMTLATLGADVIRVEQVGGGFDSQRWPLHEGRSLYRAGLDRGKRLVGIDFRSAEGQALVADLVAGGGDAGGMLVTNLPARGWLAYENLAQRRPDLIMVLIEGTREGGTAVDYTVNAGAGFPYLTGPLDSTSATNHALPAWDIAAGELAAIALLAAERRRHRSGSGGLIRIALADVAAEVSRALGYLEEARLVPEPRPRVGNAIYGTYGRDFSTADGRQVMVCALTNRQWQSLVTAIDGTKQVADLESRTGSDLNHDGSRFVHRQAIDALVGHWVAQRPLAVVSATFNRAGVLWGPYRTFKELAADPLTIEVEAEGPVRVSGTNPRGRKLTPQIGADTEPVLRQELGLDDEAVAKLRAAGVIA